jgi:cytoskeletal protein CcmA (bactofilin family)
MFGKSEAPIRQGAFETLLGKTIDVKGTVSSKGSLRIEGIAQGNILSEGDVAIGEGAKVTADIEAENVTVAGEVTGNVKCRGRLEVLVKGKINGDISARSLVVSEGALLNGKLVMGDNISELPLTEKKSTFQQK